MITVLPLLAEDNAENSYILFEQDGAGNDVRLFTARTADFTKAVKIGAVTSSDLLKLLKAIEK